MTVGGRTAIAVVIAVGVGCGGGAVPRPYPTPSLAEVLDRLAERRELARAFNHTSTMDFQSAGKDRVKTGVYVMGERGSRLRLNALDPGGGMTMADLACDGTSFAFVDRQHDCQLTGPCTDDSIATLMRVRLSPDDFVLLALGQPVLLPGELKGSVRWDEADGEWVVELVASDRRRERLELSGDAGKRWDVVGATVWSADGDVDWKLTQKDFGPIEDASGAELRVPDGLRFEQRSTKADLIVDWDERQLNPTLDATKFRIEVPAGLKECGRAR
jgi:hypothetical protein